ncbi:uncharacterized protein LOC131254729 [Magnolia sinica]|uniref:uncharacterized protein LOC131254729 n=1 Tax=Magnolia sinica TaxID=86752 RepID=UPI00265A2C24|nr:uncharacterized protein LOC131254729 [Magnolia sinica]
MLSSKPHHLLHLLPAIFLLLSIFSPSAAYSPPQPFQTIPNSVGEENGLVVLRRSVVEEIAPEPLEVSVNSTPFILAAERTTRKDPLDGYKYYTGGWNISNKHYWASVGFTGAPLFAIALIWFSVFGLTLFLICCYYCCCRRRSYSYSRTAYALSLIFLMLFTIAAMAGCFVLYLGQGKFHGSTSSTLDYVVHQANLTVDNLRNFSNDLAAAKRVGVNQQFMPVDVQTNIDHLQTKLNTSATTLSNRSTDNSKKIHDVLDTVRLFLIVVAAVMLLLAFLGFWFSVLGLQFLVYILVVIGWILVAGTFVLCGVFLLLHNVVADTCIAMDEWVSHPHLHTALDDILPCVDFATANESLYRSKEVTYQLVNVVNQVLSNVSNVNYPPGLQPLYYNQSGPLVPLLCNPFTAPGMADRKCDLGEVDFKNATQVWRGYSCQVSGGICTTQGRITPDLYNQMTAAVKVGFGIYHYTPFLIQLEDCSFVRYTFHTITTRECPGLRRHSQWIYIGLVMVSAAVMLSLIFWVIYARERRHRKYNKKRMLRSSGQETLQEKFP